MGPHGLARVHGPEDLLKIRNCDQRGRETRQFLPAGSHAPCQQKVGWLGIVMVRRWHAEDPGRAPMTRVPSSR
jgi:hypothetical protein